MGKNPIIERAQKAKARISLKLATRTVLALLLVALGVLTVVDFMDSGGVWMKVNALLCFGLGAVFAAILGFVLEAGHRLSPILQGHGPGRERRIFLHQDRRDSRSKVARLVNCWLILVGWIGRKPPRKIGSTTPWTKESAWRSWRASSRRTLARSLRR